MIGTDGIIRWGLLGCGDVTEVKSGPALRQADGSALVAVMRRDAAKAADYAARHGVPRWYDDADALIADPGVDAVYVATPPGSHLELALKVAAAGKPCYVEKPMARSAAECRAMNDAFATAGRKLFVAYYRRRLPRFVEAKRIIESGRLGTVAGIGYTFSRPAPPPGRSDGWRTDVATSGGGLFLDLGSHLLDLFDELFGPLQNVGDLGGFAKGPRGWPETAVTFTFGTPGGAEGLASWDFAAPDGTPGRDQIVVTGDAGRLEMTCFGNEPLQLTTADGKTQAFDRPNPPHVQGPLIQTVVDDLLGRGACPSTGETAARTSAVMDAVLGDYYAGRDDAFWDRPATWGA